MLFRSEQEKGLLKLAEEEGIGIIMISSEMEEIKKCSNRVIAMYEGKIAGEFDEYNDNLEEVFENREQIEISRYYEKLPKPTLIAAQEYEEGKVYFRNPAKEKEKLQ